LRTAIWPVALVLIFGLLSCKPDYQAEPTTNSFTKRGPNRKIEVEAFLFDATVFRDGKPTSLRLELFRSDTMIAVSGKGYLGKGALKGVITPDSVILYFPTSREYIREERRSFLSSAACPVGLGALDLHRIFRRLPDEMALHPAELKVIDSGKKKRRFNISWPVCDWSLELEYKKRKPGWRPQKFEFDDGASTRAKGEVRVFRPRAKVRLKRFHVDIPADATPLVR